MSEKPVMQVAGRYPEDCLPRERRRAFEPFVAASSRWFGDPPTYPPQQRQPGRDVPHQGRICGRKHGFCILCLEGRETGGRDLTGMPGIHAAGFNTIESPMVNVNTCYRVLP
jgi:hypothetical protein